MVSVKKLLLLAIYGVAFATSLSLPHQAVKDTRDIASPNNDPIPQFEQRNIEARVPPRGRMQLQWAPQGRFLFTLGMNLPISVLQAMYTVGQAGPAKVLYDNFQSWFSSNQAIYGAAWGVFNQATKAGGVYGDGAAPISNTFGFAFQTANAPTQAQMQFLLVAINDWATQGGGLMQEIARPNGFLDLAAIGAGQKKKRDVDVEPRSRGNTCPANEDILQYATIDVPDLNLNVDLRWGGTCDH